MFSLRPFSRSQGQREEGRGCRHRGRPGDQVRPQCVHRRKLLHLRHRPRHQAGVCRTQNPRTFCALFACTKPIVRSTERHRSEPWSICRCWWCGKRRVGVGWGGFAGGGLLALHSLKGRPYPKACRAAHVHPHVSSIAFLLHSHHIHSEEYPAWLWTLLDKNGMSLLARRHPTHYLSRTALLPPL